MINEAVLTEQHAAELLSASAIKEPVIDARGYQSILHPADLPTQFADYQRRDGLLIPIFTVHGTIESFQLKPNEPRIGSNGKPIKHETATNAPQVLDVPSSVVKLLDNPKQPLWITEGGKKVDSALSNGIPCIIGLQGVYGWRGTAENGRKTALPDWESIALSNRLVVVAFDSDVMVKDTVRTSVDRLSAFLRSRGARVAYLTMPDLLDGKKCGLDDWFALGKTRDDLLP